MIKSMGKDFLQPKDTSHCRSVCKINGAEVWKGAYKGFNREKTFELRDNYSMVLIGRKSEEVRHLF